MNKSCANDSEDHGMWIPYPMAIFGYLVTVCAAFAILMVEYGLGDGWDFARVYSHFFLYPLIFGPFIVLCNLRVLQLLLTMEATKRALRWLLLLAGTLVVLAVSQEFVRPAAVYEYRPAVLAQKILQPLGLPTKSAIEHFRSPELKPSITTSPNVEERIVRAKAYRVSFSASLGENSLFVKGASLTKWAYLVSFLIQTTFWISVFLTLAWSMRLYLRKDEQYLRKRMMLIPNLLWMVMLAYPWLAMRKAFEIYRSQIYDVGSASEATLLGVLFLLATFYLVAVSWDAVGERFAPILASVVGLGFAGLIFRDNWVEGAFPRHASPSHYVIVFLVVLAVIGPLVLPLSKEQAGANPGKLRQ